MNIKITNIELISSFTVGLQELASMKTSGKIAYNVAKTLKNCDIASTALNDQKKIILEEACQKDAEGKPVITDNKYVFASKEIEDKAIADVGTLFSTPIELEIYPIALADLQSLKEISAATVLRLEKFVVEPESGQMAKV